MMSINSNLKKNYKKALELGMIASLLLCHIVMLGFRFVDVGSTQESAHSFMLCDFGPTPPSGIVESCLDTIICNFPEGPELIGGLEGLQHSSQVPKSKNESTNVYRVIVHALIDTLGHVQDIRILKSSGLEKIDCRAIKAVRDTQWKPARDATNPVATWIAVPLNVRGEIIN